jgi:hypothetical protein
MGWLLLLGLVFAQNDCPGEGLSFLQLRLNQTSGYEPLASFPDAAESWCRFGDELPYWTVVGRWQRVAVQCAFASQCSDLQTAIEAACKQAVAPAECAGGDAKQVDRGVMFPSDGSAGVLGGKAGGARFNYLGHSLLCEDFLAPQVASLPRLGAAPEVCRWEQVATNTKCPVSKRIDVSGSVNGASWDSRHVKLLGQTLDACGEYCKETQGCKGFSIKTASGENSGNCMLCQEITGLEGHTSFNFYEMKCSSTPPAGVAALDPQGAPP